ncbi:hypothetical protein Leryth_001362 [Lithospermum erythrorhizon]|nr:hypothetical protein Leryth_001362 [Lithospermum erythrorhizon]
MDWYSWLFKTNLDPILVYEYGLVFTSNELQGEDLCYLDHEVLQSMGISVAKHRLEILKLAKREAVAKPKGLKRLVSAINRTKKKLFAKKMFVEKKQLSSMPISELTPPRPQPGWGLQQLDDPKEKGHEKRLLTRKGMMKSGPLDSRVQENVMVSTRNLSLSGPLDRKMHEKLMNKNGSPRRTTTLDGRGKERYPAACKIPVDTEPLEVSPRINFYSKDKMCGGLEEIHSLWSFMFQDMKPT